MDFDLEVLEEMRLRAKVQIRKRMRALRRAIPWSALQERSERIVRRITESSAYREARRVALFASMQADHEIDLRTLDRCAREQGKSVLYPMLEATPGSMSLRYATWEALENRGHGFSEPSTSAAAAETGADLLIVVPALAVGPDGHRIGYGKGYYDRLLRFMCPPAASVAVAFDFQLLAEVPSTSQDYPVQWVVTDRQVLRPASRLSDHDLSEHEMERGHSGEPMTERATCAGPIEASRRTHGAN